VLTAGRLPTSLARSRATSGEQGGEDAEKGDLLGLTSEDHNMEDALRPFARVYPEQGEGLRINPDQDRQGRRGRGLPASNALSEIEIPNVDTIVST
jgi:hypothetical protein